MLSTFTADVLRLAVGGVESKLLVRSVGLRTPLPISCIIHVLFPRGTDKAAIRIEKSQSHDAYLVIGLA
jgi:hypothetical protein